MTETFFIAVCLRSDLLTVAPSEEYKAVKAVKDCTKVAWNNKNAAVKG